MNDAGAGLVAANCYCVTQESAWHCCPGYEIVSCPHTPSDLPEDGTLCCHGFFHGVTTTACTLCGRDGGEYAATCGADSHWRLSFTSCDYTDQDAGVD